MDKFFLEILGLPLHPLAVHAAVVLMPLATLFLILGLFKTKHSEALRLFGMILAILSVPIVFVAKESGEALSEVIGLPSQHAQWGDLMVPVAAGFALVSFLAWMLRDKNKGWIRAGIAILVLIGSAGTLSITYLTGHSGAEATWSGTLSEPTELPTQESGEDLNQGPEAVGEEDSATEDSTEGEAKGESSNSELSAQGGITLAEVAARNTPEDCWVVIDGGVYDLTDYIVRHPGGSGALERLCGSDASSAFASQHAQQRDPMEQLERLLVGSLATTSG